MLELIEYIKLHILSLNQDLNLESDPHLKLGIRTAIATSRHLMSVAQDIMGK